MKTMNCILSAVDSVASLANYVGRRSSSKIKIFLCEI